MQQEEFEMISNFHYKPSGLYEFVKSEDFTAENLEKLFKKFSELSVDTLNELIAKIKEHEPHIHFYGKKMNIPQLKS